MRKTILSISVLMLIIALCGCNKLVGGNLLEMAGMKFDSQIKMIEECLSINLDDLTDSSIKTLYSEEDVDGNSESIKYISLEGAGDVIEAQIKESDRWSPLPLNDDAHELLLSNGIYDQYSFEDTDGYFTISGVLPDGGEFDFDRSNIAEWYIFEIGIWDSNDETLYFITIIRQ